VVNIAKKCLSGYIVIEAVLSLGLVALITSLVLQQSVVIHQDLRQARKQVDRYQLAQMATATGQSVVESNGVAIMVYQTPASILVFSDGREVIRVQATN
jgi:uncharacterized protein with von Willebrand factor type A (vWA) domain